MAKHMQCVSLPVSVTYLENIMLCLLGQTALSGNYELLGLQRSRKMGVVVKMGSAQEFAVY